MHILIKNNLEYKIKADFKIEIGFFYALFSVISALFDYV